MVGASVWWEIRKQGMQVNSLNKQKSRKNQKIWYLPPQEKKEIIKKINVTLSKEESTLELRNPWAI